MDKKKSTMLARSQKSIISVEGTNKESNISVINSSSRRDNQFQLTGNFDVQLIEACKKFGFSKPIKVKIRRQHCLENILKNLEKSPSVKTKSRLINFVDASSVQLNHTAINRAQSKENHTDEPISRNSNDSEEDQGTLHVTAVYDALDYLVEISLYKVKELPRILMQLIGFFAPKYENFTKITLRECGIDVYTIHELSTMLPFSGLTEICLDGSSLPEANYAILLDNASSLQHLSLCRCKINDLVCKHIASKLQYKQPSENNLLLLNLSSNHISDEGAGCLGEMLRTNRHMRYLNLSDNHITDDGVACILNVLKEFTLTSSETMEKRSRHMEYLKEKQQFRQRFLTEIELKASDETTAKSMHLANKRTKGNLSARSKNSASSDTEKSARNHEYVSEDTINSMVNEALGPFNCPYRGNATYSKNGYLYCHGNLILSYLNLSYNNLSYISIKRLYEVVTQQFRISNFGPSGLLKVVLDGNNFPINCKEMISIGELLSRNISARCKVLADASGKRKTFASSRMSVVQSKNRPHKSDK